MPKYTHDMVKAYLDGDAKKASQMQLDVIDLIEALFIEVNPTPVKYALNLMGYDYGIPRSPLIEPTDENKEKIAKVLKKHKLY